MNMIPDFGAHAIWVWSAYAATFVVIAGVAGFSLSAARRAERDDDATDASPVATARRIDDA